MRLDEPSWWYQNAPVSIAARALAPIASLYGLAAMRRFNTTKPYRARLPVICIGNFTAGGTGKTPLAIHICEELLADGEHPVFLTRGFKGRETGPTWVDPDNHTAIDVGDEPLLLARTAPTLVAVDRAAGAKFIESGARRASIIIMDDGLQNPQLEKDLTFAVIDERRQIGNGAVIPAGPLRAPLSFQLGLTNAVIINRAATANDADGAHGTPPDAENRAALNAVLKQFHGPVIRAQIRPRTDTDWLKETPVIAFAGIANPVRFFNLLKACGADIAQKRTFPDHHVFSERDAKALLKLAFDIGARLVTTEKDLARLSGYEGARAELRASALPLPIGPSFSPKDDMIVDDLLKALPGRDEG